MFILQHTPPPPVSMCRLPIFFSYFRADKSVPWTQKAPEGGLAATLRGKKVRSFLLVGVPDLECYCDVAVSAVRPDNNAELRPAAITLYVNICSGQFPADFFLNLRQDLIHNNAIVIQCGHRNGQVFLILTIHMDLANQLCVKELKSGVQVLLQISIRNSLQAVNRSMVSAPARSRATILESFFIGYPSSLMILWICFAVQKAVPLSGCSSCLDYIQLESELSMGKFPKNRKASS